MRCVFGIRKNTIQLIRFGQKGSTMMGLRFEPHVLALTCTDHLILGMPRKVGSLVVTKSVGPSGIHCATGNSETSLQPQAGTSLFMF